MATQSKKEQLNSEMLPSVILQQAKIPCRESFYEFDEKDLNGNHAATAIGMPPEQVFKTLVARGDKTGICVFCIPVCCELDLKKAAKAAGAENFEARDYTPGQVLRRSSFWMAFLFLTFLAATGSSVISFAKDLALSVNAPEKLAVSLVGVLSVCNGVGRILTGALFDAIGRRKTMLLANVLTICAAGITLLAVTVSSLPLCIIGLCLSGMSYGTNPTITAAFVSAFYGMKHYATNMALMTFSAMGASLIATVSNSLLASSGGYTAPFLMLLGLTLVSLVLNLFIRKP